MHEAPVVGTVIAIVALLLVAAVTAIVLRRANLPYTVGLVLVGLALGFGAEHLETLAFLNDLTLSPEIILFVFLPTLIFESAFRMDSRLLSRNLGPVLMLAAPGLLLSTAIVGGLVAWLTPLGWGPALVFGALISATDPVAVIALFKELGAPKRLEILVEGESLFNDATAIVLFRILLPIAAGAGVGWALVGSGVVDFGVVFVGGLMVGALVGYAMVRTIALAQDEPLVEVAISTVVAYAAFIVAEHYLQVSGVMATVGAGVVIGTLGSTRFTVQVREYLHQFWEYAAFVANSLIFLLVGLSVSLVTLLDHAKVIALGIAAVLVARAVTTFGLVPIVGQLPGAEPINWQYRTVLFWGGLRGAVALALALSLPEAFPFRELIISLAIGVVLFTLVAGGLTMGPLMRLLGLDEPTLIERVGEAQAALAAKREALERVRQLGEMEHFSNRVVTDLAQRYKGEQQEVEARLASLRDSCDVDEIRSVLWFEALAVEERTYRDLYDRGAISEPVLRELELGVELERDVARTGETPRGVPAATPVEVRVMNLLMGLTMRLAPRWSVVQRHRLRSLAARYEHDAAVLESGTRVAQEISRLAELTAAHPELADACRSEFERRSREAIDRLDSVAEHFPEFVHAVQRQTASRMALDGEADAIEGLARAGVIPGAVARDARHSVERELRELTQQPVAELTPHPEELLSRVPFFQHLDLADLTRVVEALVPRTILAGDIIIQQGQRGTSLFLIARGVVAVLIDQHGGAPQRVASLYAGDFFGEMALLTDEPRSATVQAVTDGQLFELAKPDVDALCEVCAGVESALQAAFRERKAAATQESD